MFCRNTSLCWLCLCLPLGWAVEGTQMAKHRAFLFSTLLFSCCSYHHKDTHCLPISHIHPHPHCHPEPHRDIQPIKHWHSNSHRKRLTHCHGQLHRCAWDGDDGYKACFRVLPPWSSPVLLLGDGVTMVSTLPELASALVLFVTWKECDDSITERRFSMGLTN